MTAEQAVKLMALIASNDGKIELLRSKGGKITWYYNDGHYMVMIVPGHRKRSRTLYDGGNLDTAINAMGAACNDIQLVRDAIERNKEKIAEIE